MDENQYRAQGGGLMAAAIAIAVGKSCRSAELPATRYLSPAMFFTSVLGDVC